MHTEDLLVDYSRDGQEIEYFSKAPPYIKRTIFTNALIIKPVYLSDESTLMIASQQGNPIFVSDLKCKQHQKCLNTISSTVNVVTQKDVVGIGWVAPNLKQF